MYKFPEDMKKAYESSPLSFVYYQNIDHKAIPVLVSGGFARNTGLSNDDALAWLKRGLFERMHPDDVGIVSQISDEFIHQRGPYDIVFRVRIDSADDGSEAPPQYVQMHGLGKWQTMHDGTELAVITYSNLSTTREVTIDKIKEYKMFQKDRFYTDPLTKLPNINYLHEFGEEKINTVRAEMRIPHLVYTNISSMQSYNNNYGFDEGNRLLCLAAETLKDQFPKALLTRYSDDHFVVITRIQEDELVRRLNEANQIVRRDAFGNTSGLKFGVAPIDEDMELGDALDHAKHAIRRIENDMNRAVEFFSQEAEEAYWNSRYILENIEQALDEHRIKVYYHGLFRIENSKIAAFEGLARWIDPNRGMISPGEFIPTLLRYHLLYKLDLYMFEEVCSEVKIRHEKGLPLVPVSINFSRQDFDHANILDEMNRIYDEYGMDQYVDKSYFIVEITEQDLATGEDRLHEQLRRIRENGYKLWLDDFGSGYSAINMFSQFEFDLIKYDMELMRHLDDNGGVNRLILKELVYVAGKLGIHTLIEGVETEDQLKFVKEIGCELAQGFFFHKPQSLEEILFRIKDASKIKSCETPEDREKMNQKVIREVFPKQGQ